MPCWHQRKFSRNSQERVWPNHFTVLTIEFDPKLAVFEGHCRDLINPCVAIRNLDNLHLTGCAIINTDRHRKSDSLGQKDNACHCHAPFLIHISHPLTTQTNSNDTGRNTFQPSRISWS